MPRGPGRFRKIGFHSGKAYCMFFRRERGPLASDMILAAEMWIPQELLPIEAITYVEPSAVGGDGACFKHAGWIKQKRRSKTRNKIVYKKQIN